MQLHVNSVKQRFELDLDGYIAFLDYKQNAGSHRIYYIHTEVPKAIRNRGVANVLVKEALDYAMENELKVAPLCPFVVAYLKRHPAYHSVIDESKKTQFKK